VLWIALEDACIDNACMWGIMGSHKWPLQYVSRVDHVNKTRHFERVNHDIHIPDFKSQKDSFTPLEVKAGDAILFHGNFVHCSPANQSARSRKALSLQFIETFNVSYTTSNWLQPPNHDYIFDQKTEMEVS
jgi:ectoine hydroxylase-related dioxygenase (phytanoyl-CoA dioxygenase family)